MCGIAGIWNFNSCILNYDYLKRFTDCIAHRGTDGSGYKVFDGTGLGFGHRRLSILDIGERGAQPLSYNNGKYWITYNGEIYNFIEIKNELKKNGYSFTTETDTEVILAAYDKWGVKCFDRFNGMWALGIYDVAANKLLLSRDRFGVKPLFFLKTDNCFAFASETIAFKDLENFKREFNKTNVIHGINSPNFLETSGRTLFKEIYQLPPGHNLEIDLSGIIKVNRWWRLSEKISANKMSFGDQVEQFKQLFEDACRLRLRSDVPLASALSGGIDSSAVYCMLHQIVKTGNYDRIPENWMSAFVATFPGSSQDEKSYAKKVEEFVKGDVKYIPPDYSNLASDIVSTTKLFDSITSTPLVCLTPVYKAMAEQGIKVSLDGHGFDEMMYGYPSSVAAAYYQAIISNDLEYASILEGTYAGLFSVDSQSKEIDLLKFNANKEKEWYSQSNTIKQKIKRFLFNDNNKINTLVPAYNTDSWFYDTAIGSLEMMEGSAVEKFGTKNVGERELLNEFHIKDLPYNLRDFDRGAMQNGIEIRMPFMDWRLVSLVFSLPTKSKLNNGFTKNVLREAMKGLMPEEIRTRTSKIGLSAPTSDWFNTWLSSFVMDIVSSKQFKENAYFNGKEIALYCEKKCHSKTWDNLSATKAWNVLNFYLIEN